MKKIITNLFYLSVAPFVFVYILIIPKKKKRIIWGPIPLLNIKGHSIALKNLGYDSKTLVSSIFQINSSKDFDLTYSDLIGLNWISRNNSLRILVGQLISFIYVIKYASVYNTTYYGGYMANTMFWKTEFLLYKYFNIKTIVSAYGGDVYQYSKLTDYSLKHGLLLSYPEMALEEILISKKVFFFTKHTDIIINGNQFEGLGRYDLLPQSNLVVLDDIICENPKSQINNILKIAHCPNHRGFKGTEFIIYAVDHLIKLGYNIELVLIENKKNYELIHMFKNEIDILVDQLICPTYGLNAIEGMACGLPVLCNLSSSNYSQVFRRYSFLNECPILSTTPENIIDNLKLLVDNHKLRKELGILGIDYVKKYHSIESSKHFFGKIYNQLLNGVDEDLINMYHPLKSDYVKTNYIKTPLVNNQFVS